MRHHLPLPQALIPVPLHRWRLLKRGFNQSTLIARQLSRAFHIPLYANLFTRNRSTTQQSKLAFQFRQKNIKGAFSIKAQTTPLFFSENKIEHVAIVDDVMTTGATAQALAKLLKQECKVQHVEVWTLMRAL
jgi:ComF family protein